MSTEDKVWLEAIAIFTLKHHWQVGTTLLKVIFINKCTNIEEKKKLVELMHFMHISLWVSIIIWSNTNYSTKER